MHPSLQKLTVFFRNLPVPFTKQHVEYMVGKEARRLYNLIGAMEEDHEVPQQRTYSKESRRANT